MSFTITATKEVTSQRVADLITGAFEGGSNYWIDAVRFAKVPAGLVGHNRYSDPSVYDSEFEFIIDLTEEYDKSDSWTLTREDIQLGLDKLASSYPRHAKDIVDENDDADTADAFLQCCLFQEIVFG